MAKPDSFRTDEDNPELTNEQLATLRPAAEVLPPNTMAALRRLRGPQKTPTKAQVTLRLDRDVLDHFKAGGRGWQTRLNETLRRALETARPS